MRLSPLFFRKDANCPSFSHPFLRPALLWVAIFTAGHASAQQPFITTWKTDNPGTSNSTSITLPTTGGGYNYEVDWNNDGIYDQSGLIGSVTHDFGVAGTYTIRIRGTFPRTFFTVSGDNKKLLDVVQWGDMAWTSMEAAFFGCSNLHISATDLPDLSGVTNMSQMFRACSILNGPTNIGNWNTAAVTDMSSVFANAKAFNQPIGNWNTANVTDMNSLFANAHAFNQPIGNWNTANVTNMTSLFFAAAAFNQPIGNLNTDHVTSMTGMFWSAVAFNQPIGNWNTAAVTNMYGMFNNTAAFNQPIGNWNTAAVTAMDRMFFGTAAFNQPIGDWNTAAVTDMSSMFNDAAAFNQPIGNWNTASVTNMGAMFSKATAFNQPIGNWNTANVTNMASMFSNVSAFNQPIGNWTLHPLVNLSDMLDLSGMDCDNYSATLIGWSNNPATPNDRSLGAVNMRYGTNAVAARTYLDTNKGWSIGGDAASEQHCASTLPVASINLESLVRVFPNPVANGTLTLFLPDNTEAEMIVKLFSPLGQLLRSGIIGSGTTTLNVSGLAAGVYTLQVKSGQESVVEKIVVKN